MEPPQVEVATDELAGGPARPPWRPARRHVALAGVVLGVLAVVAVGAGVQAHVHHEQALDRAALAGIFVSVVPAPNNAPLHAGTAEIAVRNEGLVALRVASLTVELPGYASMTLNALLRGGQAVTVRVPDALPCRVVLHRPASVKVRLDLVTGRGQRLSREAFAQNGALAGVFGLAERRCGLLPASFAFVASYLSGNTLGRAAEFRVRMGNDSIRALRVTSLVSAPGVALSLSSPLPLTLPAKRRPGDPVTALTVTVRVRVTDCRALLRLLRDDGGNLDTTLLAGVQLSNALGPGGGALFFGPPDQLVGPLAQLPDPLRHLLSCSG